MSRQRKTKPSKMTNPPLSTAHDLSESEIRLIQSDARAVWDEIAYDCFTALQDEGQDPVMPRDQVLELVIDAGRLDEMMRRRGHRDLVPRWDRLSYELRQQLLLPAFPYENYGM